MTRITPLALLALLITSCASGPRPPEVGRDAGRIDEARSISTMSDKEWRIRKEPAPAPENTVVSDEEADSSPAQ